MIALLFIVNNRDSKVKVPVAASFDIFKTIYDKSKFKIFVLYTAPGNKPTQNVDPLFLKNSVTVQPATEIKTKHGDPSLVVAMKELLEAAFNDRCKLTHFIFLSETCMPLWNGDVIYNAVTKCIKTSWFSRWQENQESISNRAKNITKTTILAKKIKKNFAVTSQQSLYSLSDVRTILKNFKAFFDIMKVQRHALDENIFITLLKSQQRKFLYKDEGPVLVNWDRTLVVKGRPSPYVYGNNIDFEDMFSLMSTDALFFRKVDPSSKFLIHNNAKFMSRSYELWKMNHCSKGSTHQIHNIFGIMKFFKMI